MLKSLWGLLKPHGLADLAKCIIVTIVNGSFFYKTALFHTSLRNPVESIQSDDDFDTPEVIPVLCAAYVQTFSQRSVTGV